MCIDKSVHVTEHVKNQTGPSTLYNIPPTKIMEREGNSVLKTEYVRSKVNETEKTGNKQSEKCVTYQGRT